MRFILREEPLTLTEATKIFPGRPHKNTLRRWHKVGFRGIKLRCFFSGATLCTTRAAIEEFLAAINPAQATAAAATPAHDLAEQKLDALGV